MKSQQHLKKLSLIIFIGACFISLLFLLGVFSNMQLTLSDSLYGGGKASDEIAILAIDDKSIQSIGRWPWDRNVYANLFDNLHDAKIVGVDVAFFETSNNESDSALIDSVKSNGKIIVPVEFTSYKTEGSTIFGENLLMPIPGLKEAALDVGYINVITDKDGVSRAVNLDVKGDYGSLTVAVYKHATGNDYDNKQSRYLINYVGKPGSFKTYPIVDVITGKVSKEELKDKIIFVGATSPDLHDDYFVPTSGGKAMPGVEMHANTLQTMLDRRTLKQESDFIVVLVIFLMAFLAGYLAYRLNTWVAAGLSILILIIYLYSAAFMFTLGIILNLVFVPLSLIISLVSSLIYFFIAEKKEKKQIYDAFSKYVAPEVVKDIMNQPNKLKLGGEKKEITLLFSDIRGFTTMSESLEPEDLVHLLNQYLSEMTKIVMKEKGLVDKFIGDAIMAFWNAPLLVHDHADRAAHTALQMAAKLDELNKKWEAEKLPKLKIGVGLHTGKVIVGNMGSEDRFDYTAIGDNVNLASRLEGITKQYGVPIILSESTHQLLTEKFLTRELDFVTVKGKNKPLKIYELISLPDSATEEQLLIKKSFEEGLHHYRKQEWRKAIACFERVAEIDYPSSQFIERCTAYEKNPPEKEWNGVWVLTSK